MPFERGFNRPVKTEESLEQLAIIVGRRQIVKYVESLSQAHVKPQRILPELYHDHFNNPSVIGNYRPPPAARPLEAGLEEQAPERYGDKESGRQGDSAKFTPSLDLSASTSPCLLVPQPPCLLVSLSLCLPGAHSSTLCASRHAARISAGSLTAKVT